MARCMHGNPSDEQPGGKGGGELRYGARGDRGDGGCQEAGGRIRVLPGTGGLTCREHLAAGRAGCEARCVYWTSEGAEICPRPLRQDNQLH